MIFSGCKIAGIPAQTARASIQSVCGNCERCELGTSIQYGPANWRFSGDLVPSRRNKSRTLRSILHGWSCSLSRGICATMGTSNVDQPAAYSAVTHCRVEGQGRRLVSSSPSDQPLRRSAVIDFGSDQLRVPVISPVALSLLHTHTHTLDLGLPHARSSTVGSIHDGILNSVDQSRLMQMSSLPWPRALSSRRARASEESLIRMCGWYLRRSTQICEVHQQRDQSHDILASINAVSQSKALGDTAHTPRPNQLDRLRVPVSPTRVLGEGRAVADHDAQDRRNDNTTSPLSVEPGPGPTRGGADWTGACELFGRSL